MIEEPFFDEVLKVKTGDKQNVDRMHNDNDIGPMWSR